VFRTNFNISIDHLPKSLNSVGISPVQASSEALAIELTVTSELVVPFSKKKIIIHKVLIFTAWT